jgi:hypothetical protein
MYTDVQGEELEDTQPKGYLNFETETADDETDEDTGDVAEPTQVETVATKGIGKTKKPRTKNKFGSGSLVVRRVSLKGDPVHASMENTRATFQQ